MDVTVASYALFMGAEVRGNVEISGATLHTWVQDSRLRANAAFAGNVDVYLYRNVIEGNLSCSDNGAVNNHGWHNTVGGDATGQCVAIPSP